MDFHSLPRRALQLLCKRNKIAANLTNIAMADALHSLPTVEGLDELQQESQTPIKSPTRPPNPPRSCRRNSSLIWLLLPNGRKKRAQQELPSSSMSKRRRTVIPRKASSRNEMDDDDEEEEDPTGKLPSCNSLVPCREKAECLKTYCRRRWDCSGNLTEGVSLKKHMLGCNSSVRQIAKKKKTQEESPNSSILERSRTVSSRRASGKEKGNADDDDDDDDDPVRKRLPCNTLVPCRERSVCLKTYCRRRWDCSGKLIEGVSLKRPILRCNSSVRQIAKKKKTQEESPNSSALERSRTVSSRRASSREKGDDEEEEEEEDPVRKQLPCNTLVPCRERSVCLKTYCRRLCNTSVRENATIFESAESAIGGVMECAQVGDERRRSIGVQVDIGDLNNRLLDLSSFGDDIPKITECDNTKFGNQCLDLIKKDQETTSYFLPADDHLDKECVDSSGQQNHQAPRLLTEPSPESSNMLSNARHLIRSQGTLLPESGNPIVKSQEFDASVGGLVLNVGKILEHSEDDRMESFGIHSNGEEGSDIDRKNGEAKGGGEIIPESSNMTPNVRDLTRIQETLLPEAGDPIVKSRERMKSVGVHSSRGDGTDMDKENAEEKSSGETTVEIKTQKQREKKRDLSGLSLRKLRLLYKENKEVIKLETEGKSEEEEGKVHLEMKQGTEEARFDGLSLRKLKLLYKNKVTNNRSSEVLAKMKN